jgi:hypothetical protein
MKVDGYTGEDGGVEGMTHMEFWVFHQKGLYIGELQNVSQRLDASKDIGKM